MFYLIFYLSPQQTHRVRTGEACAVAKTTHIFLKSLSVDQNEQFNMATIRESMMILCTERGGERENEREIERERRNSVI